MNLSKGPLVNSSSEDSSKSTYGKCGAGAWRMHQTYDPLEANHMRDAHALYNPRLDKMTRGPKTHTNRGIESETSKNKKNDSKSISVRFGFTQKLHLTSDWRERKRGEHFMTSKGSVFLVSVCLHNVFKWVSRGIFWLYGCHELFLTCFTHCPKAQTWFFLGNVLILGGHSRPCYRFFFTCSTIFALLYFYSICRISLESGIQLLAQGHFSSANSLLHRGFRSYLLVEGQSLLPLQ